MCKVVMCLVCNKEKGKVSDSSKKSGFRYRCLDCENERRRAQHAKRSDIINERKRALYDEKYKESAEYKQKQIEKRKALKAKGITKAISDRQAQRRREARLMASIGATCEVHNRVCVDCGKAECVKEPKEYVDIDRCYECRVRYNRGRINLGKTMPRKDFAATCPSCGVVHTAKTSKAMCVPCTKERAKPSIKKARAKRRQRIGSEHRKRARAYGCYYQPVNRLLVYARDGYMCVYCGVDVVVSRHYQENQATIDHMIPLCEKGAHSYSNVVTCCQRCNINKGTKSVVCAQPPTKTTQAGGINHFLAFSP